MRLKFIGRVLCATLAVGLAGSARAQSTATVSIQANQPGALVSSNLFGIFFEEINFAGEGGLYAEMVRNRAFYDPSNADYWNFVTQGSASGAMSVDPTQPLNTNIVNALKLTLSSGAGRVGAANPGFWGMSFESNAVYNLNFFAMAAPGFSGPITAELESADGSRVYARASFGGLTTNWQRLAASLVTSNAETNGKLVLSISNAGTIWLDVVSLFPAATFKNRTNGLRLDLATMLQALHPSFLRFPGGNFIEGDTLTNAVRWKKTIGDISQRPGHMDDAWGYWSTDGFGYYEFLQFCEDLGMQPLYAINCGLSLGWNGSPANTVSGDDLGPWVQDALDAIEYANGPTNSTWGALRAAAGHPAPFNLQYMEIGNENGGSYYDTNYAMFYDAIMSNYPYMHLIACDWGGVPASAPVQIEDQHYYSSQSAFISYSTMYDGSSRSGPQVFVGEYAVTADYGAYGNLISALGEAAFMTGMERNGDLVRMASYAPLFANLNGMQWQPDMIYYDSARGVFGTPSYYVQEMFSQNRGNVILPATVMVSSNAAYVPHGSIGVGSWNTSVQYTNLVVTSNGVTLYRSDFVDNGTNGWEVYNGDWGVANGVYEQTAQITDCYSITGNTNWANYTISLQARKTGGLEGFLILFNVQDDYDWTWWNIGGWTDTLDGIEQMTGGNKTTYAQVPQYIASNVWYYINIVLTGYRAQCYLGTNAAQAATNLVQDVTLPNLAGELLVSATYAQTPGQIIVKAVNPSSTPMPATFKVSGAGSVATNATLIELTSGTATDENSLAAPTYVFPVTNSISNAGTNFTLTLPADSLSILRLNVSGLNNYTNLLLQFASPLLTGESVASTVWGEQSGTWVNLTTNANHAIVWSSANTNIATVDASGNVIAVGPGQTTITASYPALNLSASQAVQVTYVPVTLTHRYSMNEPANSMTVTDSVGGLTWYGTLPNGGTFGDGQLSFSPNGGPRGSAQYLNLPGGIVSNYAATTIEMWIPGIAGSSSSPPFVYLFAFGNTDAGGNGYDYIFFNPNIARATISAVDPGYEGEQGGDLPSLGSASNLHLDCVFDCPNAAIHVYTNGVLAATFTGITDPLTAVGGEYAYIGRSLYTADAYLSWTLEELRIYKGALSAAQVAATDVLGPNQVLSTNPPTLSVTLTGTNLTLRWPLACAGYTIMTSPSLTVPDWTPVGASPQIVGSQWECALPITRNGNQFYRLVQ